MSLEEDVRNAGEAQYILDHPLFKGAFEAARKSLNAQFSDVKAGDTGMHTELVRRWQTLDAIERYFKRTIETGELAKREIQARKSALDRVRGR